MSKNNIYLINNSLNQFIFVLGAPGLEDIAPSSIKLFIRSSRSNEDFSFWEAFFGRPSVRLFFVVVVIDLISSLELPILDVAWKIAFSFLLH